ncbi:putative nucleotidyltransferase with HDIG domain [Desulfohalotomaculum tongense]|uniref:DVU_1551 family NTP transferase n=1 Tax=Desulforadius tongensis TaxID=1216062 RepID=UPI00195A32EF|nr:NTP transferase domain-containing protein [Desulforadius tongensis]MBM7855073.1 putative nucleotidyltransferase with HDIG domain [Desulforadius tongensis]
MKPGGKIAALVVAGGYSSRMGLFKPLLPLGAGRVIEKPVHTFRQAGIEDVRVVVGHNAAMLIPVLQSLEVEIIYNHRYADGMFSSVLAGVKSLETGVEAFFLLPADIPLVRVQTVKEILQAFRHRGTGIIYPCFQGRKGHPPLISSFYIKDIISWNKPGGLRALLSQYPDDSLKLEVADEGVLMDMDTKDDYQKILAYHRRQHIPTAAECLAILNKFGAAPRVVNHCRAVAGLAKELAIALNKTGCRLDVDLITSAALLHDLAKGKPGHAQTGAAILRQLGFAEVAEIVACHMDIAVPQEKPVTEAEVVYLADKLIKEDCLVPLEIRFEEAREKYAHKPNIMEAVLTRFQNARIIKKRVDDKLGEALEKKVIAWNKG